MLHLPLLETMKRDPRVLKVRGKQGQTRLKDGKAGKVNKFGYPPGNCCNIYHPGRRKIIDSKMPLGGEDESREVLAGQKQFTNVTGRFVL